MSQSYFAVTFAGTLLVEADLIKVITALEIQTDTVARTVNTVGENQVIGTRAKDQNSLAAQLRKFTEHDFVIADDGDQKSMRDDAQEIILATGTHFTHEN